MSIPSTTTPGGTIDYNFGSVTGGSGVDASITFEFFVPRLDASASRVLAWDTADDKLSYNQAYTYADWTPIDTRDSQTRVADKATVSGTWPAQTVTPDAAPEHTLSCQANAIQKTAAVIGGDGTVRPGAVIEYTLNFQISDYFAFTNLVITDTNSDGQLLDGTFTPTLTVTEHGNTLAAATLTGANWGHGDLTDGIANNGLPLPAQYEGGQWFTFDVSAELRTRSFPSAKPGRLLGGGVTDALTQEYNNPLTAPGALPFGGTVGTLKFRVVIQDAYRERYPSGEATVNSKDSFSDTAFINGDVLNATSSGTYLKTTGYAEADDTAATLTVPIGVLTKSIYAVNGSTSVVSPVNLHPGDTITYRITYTLPTGDAENFFLKDYLPLPVLRASEINTTFIPTADATVPAAGRVKYGATDTFHLLSAAPAPTLSVKTSSGNNTITFTYGTYSNPLNTLATVDLLFTVTVTTDPFADGLYLTNEGESSEQNTVAAGTTQDKIIRFIINEPNVKIYKGVVGSTQTGGKTISGLTLGAPGNALAFTAGTFTTTNQAAAIAAEDLLTGTLPDANDKVRYAAALQNTGRSDSFDTHFFDTIPSAYVKPAIADPAAFATAVNLKVQRGGGTLLAYGTDYLVTWDQPSGKFTVELVDNYNVSPGLGGLNRGYNNDTGTDITDGSNGAIITYDLTLAATTAVNTLITNAAVLDYFAGGEGGTNFLTKPLTNIAKVLTASPAFVKAVTGTEVVGTGNGQFQAVIGEKVTYTLTVTVPEGLTPAAQIVDTLDQGLAFVQLVSTTPSSGVTVANNPATVSILDSGVARSIRFTLGDIQNNNTGNLGNDTVTLTFQAVVLNQNTLPTAPGNQAGTTLANTAQFTATGVSALNSTPAQTITVVEPTLTLGKQVAPDNAGVPGAFANTLGGQMAGNVIYYQLTVANPNTANDTAAYDLSLTDTLPAYITAAAVFSVTPSGSFYKGPSASPYTPTASDFAINAGVFSLVPSDLHMEKASTLVVVIRGTVAYTVNPGQSFPNSATITWTSLNGSPGQRSAYNTASTERTGGGGVGTDTAVLNNYAAVSTAGLGTITIASASMSKAVTTEITANPGNNASQAVIGEYVTYTLTLTVPQGTTPSAVITDTMAAGLAFVDLQSVTPSSGVSYANSFGTLPSATPTSVTVQNSGGTGNQVIFNLGTINDNNAVVATPDTITLVYRAVVLNTNAATTPFGNQAGITLQNSANLTYTGISAAVTAQAPVVTIVEPTLTVTKTISSTTSGFAATLAGQDAGNPVYYQVVIANANGAGDTTAYDLELLDTLPTIFTPDPTTPINSVASSGTIYVNGAVTAPAAADFLVSGGVLRTNDTRIISLEKNSSITLVMKGTLAIGVNPSQTYNNTVTIRWSSLPGDVATASRSTYNATGKERTGAGLSPLQNVNDATADQTILNNYAASAANAAVTISSPILNKIIVATSESHTADNLILADFNNTPFTTLAGTWVGNVTAQPQFIRIGGTATGTGGSGTLTFGASQNLTAYNSLGVVVRAGSGNANTTMQLTLTDSDNTTARFDVTMTGLIAGAPSFTNCVSVLFTAPSSGPTGGDGVLNLGAITSIKVAGSAAGAVAWDVDRIYALRTLVVPGEIVRYRLTVELPEGTTPDMRITDTLGAGLRFINDGSARVAFVSSSGSAITSTASGTGGDAVPAISGGGVIGNGDTLSSISLAVGGGNGVALADANISSGANANADTYNAGTAVYFKLGNIVNAESDADAEYVVLEFNAVVANDNNATATDGSAIQAGVQYDNTFLVRTNSGGSGNQIGATSLATDFSRVVIVEPQINNLAKTITAAPVDAGDPITYQVKFSNNSSHPAQYAPAVRVATAAALASGTFNATGGSGGTGRYTGAPAAVDGITLAEGDRVLVKDQATPSQNGVYKVVDSINGIWDRATDFDTAVEMTLGYRAAVANGTANAGKTFALDAAVATINNSSVTFSVVAANPAVRVATSANIAGTFAAGPPTTLTGIALTSGNLPIDGVNVALGDRVLLKSQTTGLQNGIYTVTSLSGTATLTRATDFDTSAEAVLGLQTYVSSGNLNGGRTFAHSTTAAVTLNTTALTWTPVDPVTAFDLVLTDPLPTGVLFQSVTVTTPDVPGGQTFTVNGSFTGGSITVPSVGSSGTITMNLISLLPESKISGSPKDVTIAVNGTVATTAVARQELVNPAQLTFTSLPGTKGTASNPTGTDPTTSASVDASGGQYGERNGSGVAATDNTPVNYNTTQRNNYSVASTVIASLDRPTVDKAFKDGSISADDTSLASTAGANVAIGEQVTYDILVTLPEGITPNVVVSDVVPAGLRLDSYSVITASSGSSRLSQNFNGSFANNPPTLSSALPASGTAVTFTFGLLSRIYG